MGILLSRHTDKPRVKKIIDKVFYELADTDHSQVEGEQTVNFAELYIGVLLVYNEINKVAKAVHSNPPSRQEVAKLLEEYDHNKDGVLDRAEFENFMMHFTDGAAAQVTGNLVLACVLVPGLVFATKAATRPIDKVGPVVNKVPEAILATAFFVLLSAAGLKMK